jgi:hypothetical protein
VIATNVCAAVTADSNTLVPTSTAAGGAWAPEGDGAVNSLSNPTIASVKQIASASAANYSQLCTLDGDEGLIAFAAGANDKLITYKYNTSTSSIAKVGNALSVDMGAGGVGIAAISPTKVIVHSDTTDTLQVYVWDGTDWATESSAFPARSGGLANVNYLSGDDMLLEINGNTRVWAYTYDQGTQVWASSGFSDGLAGTTYNRVTALTSSEFFHYDDDGDTIRRLRLSAGAFTTVGTNFVAAGLANGSYNAWAMSDTRVMMHDSVSHTIRVYEYSSASGTWTSAANLTTAEFNTTSWPRTGCRLSDTHFAVHSYGSQTIQVIRIVES